MRIPSLISSNGRSWNKLRMTVFWSHTSAFTLVELLLVITIISIVGVMSISSFSRIGESGASESVTKSIASILEGLDKDIGNHRVTSYETTLLKGSVGLLVNRNFYKKTSPVQLSFDFTTGSWVASSTDTSSGIWFLELLSDGRKYSGDMMTANGGVYKFSYPEHLIRGNYEILSTLGDTDLNSFLIRYYNEEDGKSVTEKQISITSITCWWSPYSSITIRNILGKKEYITSIGEVENCTIIFDKNGKESILDIKK